MKDGLYKEVKIGPIPHEQWQHVSNVIMGTQPVEKQPFRSAHVEPTVHGNILHLRIPIGEKYSLSERTDVLMRRMGKAGLL